MAENEKRKPGRPKRATKESYRQDPPGVQPPEWVPEIVIGGASEWLPTMPDIRVEGEEPDPDVQIISLMASYFCTQAEIAGVLRITEDMFENRLRERPEYRAAWVWGLARAKASLRRRIWFLAQGNGSPAVAACIHLAKHMLGETEKAANEPNQPNAGVSFDPAKLKNLSTEELVALAGLIAKLSSDGAGGDAKPSGANFH
jgi:hypothetical protein